MKLIIGVFITYIITFMLKNIFKIPIPDTFPLSQRHIDNPHTIGWSFPSGHASTTTFVFGSIYKLYPSIYTKILFIFAWYHFAFKSYLLGYHRLSETIAGTILGIIMINLFF